MDTNPKRSYQLNPFAFPPETNIRFTFLVIAAFSFIWIVGWIYMQERYLNRIINIGEFNQMYATEMYFFRTDVNFTTGEQITPDQIDILNNLRQALQTLRTLSFEWSLMSMVFPLFVAVIALLFYLTHPYFIQRRRKMHRLTPEVDPEVYKNVQGLSLLAGIATPRIETQLSSTTLGGQVFGIGNSYILGLGGRMRLLFRKNTDKFNTIVLHELAHITNRDIQRTYFAQAIWAATVLLVFIPEIVDEVSRTTIEGALNHYQFAVNVFRTIATVLVIRLIGSSLVQTREVYADWRVALWGKGKQLKDILKEQMDFPKNRWKSYWFLHPSSEKRLAALQNPSTLFILRRDIPFIAGILSSFFCNNLISISISLDGLFMGTTQLWYNSFLLYLISTTSGKLDFFSYIMLQGMGGIGNFTLNFLRALVFLPAGLMVAGTLGVQEMRSSIIDLEKEHSKWHSFINLLIPAILYGAGTLIGFLITPFTYFYGLNDVPQMIKFTFYCFSGFTFTIWIWLAFVRHFSRVLMGSYTHVSFPQLRLLGLILWSSLLLCFIFAPFLNVALNLFVTPLYKDFTQTDLLRNIQALPYDAISNSLVIFLLIGLAILISALIKVSRWIRPPRCQSCSKPIRQKFAVGNSCMYCGNNLAPWLYVESTPVDTNASVKLFTERQTN